MRILIAPDAFKGSLTAVEAARAMVAGIRTVMPDAEIIAMPLADGGEGTLDVVHAQCGGDVRNDMLYFKVDGTSCALIESARLIGLNLPGMQADVFERSSAKLGVAILSALDAGVQDIRIALGGSATVDGGSGLLATLGCRVLNQDGLPVLPDLNGLMSAELMDASAIDPRLNHVRITVLSDVQNSLCGSRGAVYVYGSQKGIQDNRLAAVESSMQHWGGLCEQTFGVSVMRDAGAGAAGGLGFALKLLGAEMLSGAEYVMHACGFEQFIQTVDWVVTGEGKSDAQTLDGKLPMVVAAKARSHGVKTALISGMVEQPEMMQAAFDAVCSCCPSGISVQQAMANAEPLLQQAAAEWADALI